MEYVQVRINEDGTLRNQRYAFSDRFTLITELLQNSRRAGATLIEISHDPASQTLRVIDDGHAWIDWDPPARWHDGEHLALLPAIAALDCTSAIPLRDFGVTSEAETVLLGTYDGRIHRRPPAAIGESYRIVTSTRRRDRRKIYADIGLFAPDGEVFITGCATWIVLAA